MRFHRLDDVLGLSKCIGALIILNGPHLEADLLNLVWPLSRHPVKYPTICADGGANLLYDLTHSTKPNDNDISIRLHRIPNYIVGDLDSVKPPVKQWYQARGTQIRQQSSQDSNDFQKALRVAESLTTNPQLPVVVIGGWGGRMDQTLGNLNTLICAAESHRDVYWVDGANVVLALEKGLHHISIDASREGPFCGLVPFGGPAERVRTEGLKWNLDAQKLECGSGGLISTSNEIVEPVVVVETSSSLIWTSELRVRGE